MKKLILSILFVLLWTGVSWGSTYYVSASGTNAANYETWAKAANIPSTAVTAGNTDVGGDGPHVMYIGPGTYTSTILLNDADWDSGSFYGVSAAGVAAGCVGSACQAYPAAILRLPMQQTCIQSQGGH
jgi:hypothetical protein